MYDEPTRRMVSIECEEEEMESLRNIQGTGRKRWAEYSRDMYDESIRRIVPLECEEEEMERSRSEVERAMNYSGIGSATDNENAQS
ncbi:hypothetical protein ElyMa_000149900 [Elysia marginata]|uniref:Uncharacterized protein n=1 Tax=Elysia marginata TaxID=1093978 RepID=A0AAV4EQ99_9GAST|nr:hypothetical protein ElyMa_000149900 [Elysia marginata]